MLDRMFHLRDHGTPVGTEVVAGLTTFMIMAYIIFVNPAILSFAGVPALGGQGPPSRRPSPRRASSPRSGPRPWAS